VPLPVEPALVEGRWLRHVPHGADPLGRPDPPPDSRWQRGAVVPALYLADGEETVWAEWYRHLAEAGLPPDEALPRDLWPWDVRVRVADLSTPERLEEAGLAPPSPGRRTWAAFQRLGETLFREGWPGLLAPSAARPEGLVLCLFRPQETVAGARPVPPPRVVRRPPAPPAGMRT